MANQSSSNPILCASFNLDTGCFAVGTRDGIKIFDSNTGRLCYERGNDNFRSGRSGNILGSIIPVSVSDALDPAHHAVLHNAAPAGMKSYAVVRKVDKVADSSTSEIVACRATISTVTYNGYFQEYKLTRCLAEWFSSKTQL